jgi:hypothetical protein
MVRAKNLLLPGDTPLFGQMGPLRQQCVGVHARLPCSIDPKTAMREQYFVLPCAVMQDKSGHTIF